MKRLLISSAFAVLVALSGTLTLDATAREATAQAAAEQQRAAPTAGRTQLKRPQTATLRTIAPNRGRLVPTNQLKANASGGAAAVCCTHWNTSTGGTGCATFPGSCPDNTFTVSCGPSGCW